MRVMRDPNVPTSRNCSNRLGEQRLECEFDPIWEDEEKAYSARYARIGEGRFRRRL